MSTATMVVSVAAPKHLLRPCKALIIHSDMSTAIVATQI